MERVKSRQPANRNC